MGDATLKSGMVVNTHTNGVQNFAHEIHRLSGAEPDTTYQVVLIAYHERSHCTGAAKELPTTTLTTNAAGNGTGDFAIRLATADAIGIHRQDVSARWEVRLGDTATAMYRTAACEAISLDCQVGHT